MVFPKIELTAPEKSAKIEKTKAAIGAVPYEASNETWLALSNLVLGTKLGTDASFAGDQNKVTISTKIVAV
ncbi:unannotated protein [freshwater metagenome]|uniref:Unannotated protein n=1 Tax=freshwater metagenome TaxID=449393 RepID=A0A6J6G322_9ZZZZ